jgi:hypothetical protein
VRDGSRYVRSEKCQPGLNLPKLLNLPTSAAFLAEAPWPCKGDACASFYEPYGMSKRQAILFVIVLAGLLATWLSQGTVQQAKTPLPQLTLPADTFPR